MSKIAWEKLKEDVAGVVDGIDAILNISDGKPTREDFEAVQETLKQILREWPK